MTDRPIIFSAPMILALLAGRKTMTRRLAWADAPRNAVRRQTFDGGKTWLVPSPWQQVQPGDRLWVREAWAHDAPDLDSCRRGVESDGPAYGPYYRATERPDIALTLRWRPPIHMPRWASRLTLHMAAARVERLHDMTEEDAMAEGAEPQLEPPDGGSAPHVAGFSDLWDSLHGDGAWRANPEVVVLSFSVLRSNIDLEF